MDWERGSGWSSSLKINVASKMNEVFPAGSAESTMKRKKNKRNRLINFCNVFPWYFYLDYLYSVIILATFYLNFSSPISVMTKTTYDYAEASGLHGMAYIFSKKLCFIERFVWFVVWLGSVVYCIWSVSSLYEGWQNNLVLTTVRTTGNVF